MGAFLEEYLVLCKVGIGRDPKVGQLAATEYHSNQKRSFPLISVQAAHQPAAGPGRPAPAGSPRHLLHHLQGPGLPRTQPPYTPTILTIPAGPGPCPHEDRPATLQLLPAGTAWHRPD